MPRTWRAGGIIGPTTAKQNAGTTWSVCNTSGGSGGIRRPKKLRLYLIKLAEEDGVADNFTEEDEFPEENAAVLEKLEKNGAEKLEKY